MVTALVKVPTKAAIEAPMRALVSETGLLAEIERIPVSLGTFSTRHDLAADVATMSRAMSLLMARIAGRVEDQRRLGPHPEGLTLTRWVAVHADVSNTEARRVVALGRTLTDHPETGERLVSGDLSRSRVEALSRAADAHPEEYGRDEEILLGLAETHTISNLNRALRYWRNCVDDSADFTAEQQCQAAYLHASVTYAGMVRLDGFLDPETGEALLTALDAATSPPDADERRPPSNRRAEALGQICEEWLRNGTTINGGVRAAVNLVVDLDTLEGRMGSRCELEHTGPITPGTARRILCDADISRVITSGESTVLDLGRTTRVPSPGLRRALNLRDRGCRFRGCERPPTWCDAHHITAWVDGGPSDLSNLILLCRRHHTLVHEHGTTIRDGTVILT